MMVSGRGGIFVAPSHPAIDAIETAAMMVNEFLMMFMFVSCLMFDGVLVKFTLHLQQFQVAKCVGAFY